MPLWQLLIAALVIGTLMAAYAWSNKGRHGPQHDHDAWVDEELRRLSEDDD